MTLVGMMIAGAAVLRPADAPVGSAGGLVLTVVVPLIQQEGPSYDFDQIVEWLIAETGAIVNASGTEYVFVSGTKALAEQPRAIREAVQNDADHFRFILGNCPNTAANLVNAGWKGARGKYITVQRPEDRFASSALVIRRRYMELHASCGLLSSAVLLTSAAGRNFEDVRTNVYEGALFDTGLSNLVYPSNLFLWSPNHGEGRRRRTRSIAGINGVGRNSAVWRNSLKDTLGYLDPAFEPLADWEFFLRATTRGQAMCHMHAPLQTIYQPRGAPRSDQYKQMEAQVFEKVSILYAPFVNQQILIINEDAIAGIEGSHVRLAQILEQLMDAGHQVTYVAKNPAWNPPMKRWVDRVQAKGVRTIVGDEQLTTLTNLGNFDLVIMAAWYWRCGASSIPDLATAMLGVAHSRRMVVLSDDIHWIRASQQQLVDTSCQLYTGPVKDRELRDYSRADMIWSVTEEDAVTMRPYLKNDIHAPTCVRHIPYVAKHGAPAGVEATFNMRKDFLYVGSHHYGNRLAVTWLIDEVMPFIRRLLPGSKLILVGADIWSEYAAKGDYIQAYGVVADLTRFLRKARVMLLPNLVGGSGISTKTLLALENGIPFITTPKGTTGTTASATPEAFRISNMSSTFATLAVDTYLSEELWSSQVKAMRRHVQAHLSTVKLSSMLQQALYVAGTNQCVSPRWTKESLEKREHHRSVRLARAKELLGAGGRPVA